MDVILAQVLFQYGDRLAFFDAWSAYMMACASHALCDAVKQRFSSSRKAGERTTMELDAVDRLIDVSLRDGWSEMRLLSSLTWMRKYPEVFQVAHGERITKRLADASYWHAFVYLHTAFPSTNYDVGSSAYLAAKSGKVSVLKFLRDVIGAQLPLSKVAYGAGDGGHVDVLDFLLDSLCCEPRQRTDAATTVLERGLSSNHRRIVEAALQRLRILEPRTQWRNLFLRHQWWWRCFGFAIAQGHADVVEFFCDHETPVSLDDLNCAVRYGHYAVLSILLRSYSCKEGGLQFSPNAIAAAAALGASDVVELVLDLMGPGAGDPNVRALPLAASSGHLPLVQRLCARSKPTSFELSEALFKASVGGHVDIVEHLLDFADLHEDIGLVAQDVYGALNFAAGAGHARLVERLLGAGYRPVQHTLVTAVEGGHEACVRLILRSMQQTRTVADKTGKEKYNRPGNLHQAKSGIVYIPTNLSHYYGPFKSALYAAVVAGSESIVRLLLEHGHQHGCYARRHLGHTVNCIDHAAGAGALGIVSLLQSVGQEFSEDALVMATESGRCEMVRFLLSASCPRAPTLGHCASSAGRADVVRLLHEAGVSFTGKDVALAAKWGHLEAVEYLLKVVALPLENDVVAIAANGGHVDVVQFLLSNDKCPPTASAVYAAATGGHLRVVHALVKAGAIFNVDKAIMQATMYQNEHVYRYLTSLRIKGT